MTITLGLIKLSFICYFPVMIIGICIILYVSLMYIGEFKLYSRKKFIKIDKEKARKETQASKEGIQKILHLTTQYYYQFDETRYNYFYRRAEYWNGTEWKEMNI